MKLLRSINQAHTLVLWYFWYKFACGNYPKHKLDAMKWIKRLLEEYRYKRMVRLRKKIFFSVLENTKQPICRELIDYYVAGIYSHTTA